MRIFQVCADPGIPPDGSKGASVHLRSIAQALACEGCEITTFARRRPTSCSSFPVPLQELDEACEALEQAARLRPPEVIHERYALGHCGGLEAARRLGVPFVLEVNAPLVQETRRFRPQRLSSQAEAAELRLLREADLVVCVSEPLRRWVDGLRGDQGQTRVVPNGFDPELHPHPAPGQSDPPVLIFLGHPKPWHGALRLPQILKILLDAGLDVRCLVIGGGSGADQVAARADELGVQDALEITGAVSPAVAARQLQTGTMLLAPYPHQEDFYFCPLKVLEGMAAGIPVVASNLGDIPALLQDTGVLVPAGDDDALASAVASLLGDPDRCQDLGRRGRERAFAHFTWRHQARLLLQHMVALLEEQAS